MNVPLPWLAAALFGLGLLGTGAYAIWTNRALTQTRAELASSTASYERMLEARDAALQEAAAQNVGLAESLARERRKNGDFEDTLGQLSSTVGSLKKLAETDPELLAKYSKVYFLNENYAPSALAQVPPELTHDKKRAYEFHTEALPFLLDLLRDADAQGLGLRVVSAYRSFGEQSSLKASYRVTYGAASSNRFSADQGYSEHQLGTALDFTTDALGADFTRFEETPAYAWLEENAWRYGFILSYPEPNAYYIYEPWHWRFVGLELARSLKESNRNFYDLDQRSIDGYLGSLFDR